MNFENTDTPEAGEWNVRYFAFPKPLVGGGRSGWVQLLARRKIDGKWHYRRPTPEEERQHFDDAVW